MEGKCLNKKRAFSMLMVMIEEEEDLETQQ